MSNYVKATNFTAKDSLLTGNPAKIIKGAEIDDEFNLISTAIATKPDSNSPAFTGIPVAPTAAAGTNTTQIATTAFVTSVVNTLGTMSTQNKTAVDITGGTVVGITDLAVADGGTGVSTLAANAVVLGNGTNAVKTVAPGTSGNVLTSNGTTWQSSPRLNLLNIQYFTSTATYTPTAGTSFVVVEVVGGGAGGTSGAAGGTGGTTSFGSLVSATGGSCATNPVGGTGSSGDLNLTGGSGVSINTSGIGSSANASGGNAPIYSSSNGASGGNGLAINYASFSSNYGSGGGVSLSSNQIGKTGGGGGYAIKRILSAFSGVTVTVGAGGAAVGTGGAGIAGLVIVYEYA